MLRIHVTGAAGLIGGEVCARLVARGHQVTGIVRRNKQVRGNNGAKVPLVALLQGDVTCPYMDLDPHEDTADVVIHCAASVEFEAPEEELRSINVDGTRNALAYAREIGASFLHVSTAYVCGLSQGTILEGPVPADTQFSNRYEASKAEAELEVAASGLPFAIARPAIVLGEYDSGAIRDFPSFCNVFRLMARSRVTVFPASATSTLNLVPICHVTEGITRLAEKMDAANRGYFHLVSSTPLPAAELAHGVARQDHLPSPEVVEPEGFDLASLSPVEQRVAGRMLETFGGYFKRDPRFDDSKLRALTGLACPKTDPAWLDRLVDYAISRNYLPQPKAA